MASIYKKPNSPYWYAQYRVRTATGWKLVRLSTKIKHTPATVTREVKEAAESAQDRVPRSKKLTRPRFKNVTLYLFLLPSVIYVFIFCYIPMAGLIIAFKDYNAIQGLFGSPWAGMGGFEHFYNFVTLPNFWQIIQNTLVISVTSIVFNTILPIILALIVNEIICKWFKNVV